MGRAKGYHLSEETKRKISEGKRRDGRVILYRPDHPRARKSGYILRSRLIWEAHHGPLSDHVLIHYKNGDPTDDEIQNLEAVSKGDHVRIHKPWRGVGWLKRLRAKLIEAEGWG